MTSARENEDLPTHVALCDERYDNMRRQIAMLRSILLWGVGFVIVQLVGVIGYLMSIRPMWPPVPTGL